MTTVAKLQVLLRSRLNMTSLFFSSSFSLSISLLCFCVLFGCFLSFLYFIENVCVCRARLIDRSTMMTCHCIAHCAWPGPWYFRITGRSLTKPARFLFPRPSAKPGSRHTFHLVGHLCPAWPVTSSGHFCIYLSSSCVSSSLKFGGHDLLVSPRPAVSLGSRLMHTSGVRSRVCHAPIMIFGYRWCAWVA